ncbi:MAG TPA: radical SAM protein [Planctomycetota bacterium]|nr:radical SAM protein [Planctomycetota bacterium]
MKVKYVKDLDSLHRIPPAERARLDEVARKYAFRVNDYYLGLIDWNDPDDPIRRLVIPDARELEPWGRLDASNERAYTVARGVQHKYPRTVLLLVNEVCGAYCRYCFRKRLFMDGSDETSLDVSEGISYIREHPAITNVLLTGGDPLLLGTRRILEIVESVRAIPHVGIIRIGSKMPAFDPWRILDDPELVQGLSRNSTPEKRVYLMAHFDHPRELTEPALRALDTLIRAGVICVNQCPIIRGINDSPDTLETLFRRLSFAGVPPYYLFQGRPTEGNEPFEVPIVEGYFAFEEAKKRVSGLAKRARFCMSHETGKIEVVGVDRDLMYLRYHRARDPADEGRFMVFRRDDRAYWLDSLVPADGGRPPALEAAGPYEMAVGPE